MSKNKNDEPRDEFDRIQIPEFLARPFERLGSRPGVGTPGRPTPQARPDRGTDADGFPDAGARDDAHRTDDTNDIDGIDGTDDTEPVQRQWWSGYKGKFLLYGAGTLVMVFLQSRGSA